MNADAWVDENIGRLSQMALADVLRAWDNAKRPAPPAQPAAQARSASYHAGRKACAAAYAAGPVQRLAPHEAVKHGGRVAQHLSDYVDGWNGYIADKARAVFNVGE